MLVDGSMNGVNEPYNRNVFFLSRTRRILTFLKMEDQRKVEEILYSERY